MTRFAPEVEKMRYKLRFADSYLKDRSIANDEQLFDFKLKLRDLIEELDYKIDIADCLTMLHEVFEDLEMYE